MNKWEAAYLYQRRNLSRREKRIKLFNIRKDKSILDYGCGDGLDLSIFKKLGYKKIFGLDNSKDYLSKIENEFKVYLADGCDTGLPSESFDVVFVNSTLHHVDLNKALKEIKRILKNGGELCLIEPRATVARKILDFATVCPFCASFGYLKKRRVTLTEERETYYNWLRQQPFLIKILEKFGFRIVFNKGGLATVMIKCISQ